MADILIRGMEMPTNRDVTVRIDPDGEVYFYNTYPTLLLRAVTIQEGHGRLIDADALLLDSGEVCEECGDGFSISGFSREQIENAPTIVPAEGGEADA